MSAESTKTILVCSAHPLLVAGFRSLIAEPAGYAVLECTAPDRVPVTDPPDLALIDVDLILIPQCLNQWKLQFPATARVLWADGIRSGYARDALYTGIRGILPQKAPVELYLECLRETLAGRLWLENDLKQQLLSIPAVRLSPRERELIGMLTEGLRNKEIAWRMKITEGTAKAYLSRLFEKTGASDRFELAMFALQNLEKTPAAGPSRPKIYLPIRKACSRQA